MYHNLTIPETALSLWQECQSLVPVLLQDYPVQTAGIQVDREHPLEPQPGSVYLVKEGEIFESFDGQLIVIYEKGDLINAEGLAHTKSTVYSTDFPASIDAFDGQQLLNDITADTTRLQAWHRYLSCLSQAYQILMCYFSRQDTDFLPEFRQYHKGDVIIQEDAEGDEVFTLLKGTAKVVRNNEQVGEIQEDEIFGAIAALTNTRRTATVIATSDCDTLVARSENFRSILATRPDIAQKLLQDMARTIVSSNERIIELSRERPDQADT